MLVFLIIMFDIIIEFKCEVIDIFFRKFYGYACLIIFMLKCYLFCRLYKIVFLDTSVTNLTLGTQLPIFDCL